MAVSVKRCFKCGRVKPKTDFYAHGQMADGYLNKCKACTRADVSANRSEKLTYYRAYDRERARLPHRVAKQAQITKRWREMNPLRYRAHSAVSHAIRDGRLRPMPCWVCGDAKSVAHHPDYSAPLDVVWLCQAHHKAAHAAVKLELENADA